ncbi:hypothetical protein J4573_52505 [Actinomadura barringtoniae]|uniref:Serine/arginine repetitive matrix protein 2 n=1 Tax=Actinomadura barringtoniae TaxID=1427535 RepID=A0A939T776_9ACTN|nr:hypothetical protein [Actinomadura barringtoniae]MBO2455781.1 hypothetical protein [Actinomadura barringtoniae]
MWAGPNAPMLPPQGPGQPWAPRQPVRPRAGWYALPAILILSAVVSFGLTLAVNFDDTRVSDDPSAAGNAATGVTVGMVSGHSYFVYVRDGASAPTACSIRKPGTAAIPLDLTKKNDWASSDYKSYHYASTFQAPFGGNAVTVTCQGVNGSIVVMPDDTSSFYLGIAVIVGGILGGLGVIAFIVIIVRRRNAKRTIRSGPPPPARPAYPHMPPPGPYGG